GSAYMSSGNKNDVALVKYNSSGTMLWAKTYNGSDSKDDAGTSMTFYNGNIFIAAATETNSNGIDFLVLSYNSSGNLIWDQYWDFNNMDDAPHAIVSNGGAIDVAGAAQSSSTTWKYAVVKLNASN